MPTYFEDNSLNCIADFDYYRIPRSQWSLMLTRLKQMGVEAIYATVPWGFHELIQGTIDVTGTTRSRRDLVGLLTLAHDLNLRCILNLGPYTDASILGEGLPAWLLQTPSTVSTQIFALAKDWYKALSPTLIAEQWPQGPIIALEVDESGIADQPPTLSSQITEVKWPIWLRKRYNGIDALNETYGTDYRTVSRVPFPETWHNEATAQEQDAKKFLEEIQADIETSFAPLFDAAGWTVPIYGLEGDATLPTIEAQSAASTSPEVLANTGHSITRLRQPIEVDPDPADVGTGLAWATDAPIRRDGSLRRHFWAVRHALWMKRLGGEVADGQFMVATNGALIVSAPGDGSVKIETAAAAKTPAYRLGMNGHLAIDENLKISRKKLSGDFVTEDHFGQTDLVLLLDDPESTPQGFVQRYLLDLLQTQAHSLQTNAHAAAALSEMLAISEPSSTSTPSSSTPPERPTSYILGEAKRGLREADAALRRAMSSIGELEGGFATMLNKDQEQQATPQPAAQPVAINPAAFDGPARQYLIDIGEQCGTVAKQLDSAADTLQDQLNQPDQLTLTAYQEAQTTATAAAEVALETLQESIAQLRLGMATEQLPLVLWRVHDLAQDVADSLRWGVVRK